MSVTLINGNGNPAVYASQDSDWFGAITGNQTVIMNVNQNLAYELLDNNTLVLKSGVLVTKEGRRVQIDVGDTEEITIPTGTQNVNRFYICGFKLTTDNQGVQSAETFIEQMGSSTETITEEQFKDGATNVYVSLYRIYQIGITIQSVTPLLDVVSIPTTRALSVNDLIDIIHPIGKIFFTDDPRNPSEYYPGTTWVAWGSGRVPVGVNTSDSDFNIPNKTVGAKSHTYTPAGTVGNHTLNASEIPSHYHCSVFSKEPDVNHPISSSYPYLAYRTKAGEGGDAQYLLMGLSLSELGGSAYTSIGRSTTTGGGGAHNHPFTGTASTQSHIQPSITCYMWKRTA